MSLSTVRDIWDCLSSSVGPIPVPVLPVAANSRCPRIGYKEARDLKADSISPAARNLKWYFAHASVGSNLLGGLKDLNASDPAGFSYGIQSSDGKVLESTQAGTIYEHNRGNPGWKAKMDRFSIAVGEGWRFPAVDVVVNKLCYIDQFASAKYYVKSMCGLEERYPETIFVYATMPLTTDADWRNRMRNSFNREVRDWTQSNNRILFDIADIEAHDQCGCECTFEHGGRRYARLCSDYTDDGGHLNTVGRQLVARGLYALTAVLGEISGRETKGVNANRGRAMDIAA